MQAVVIGLGSMGRRRIRLLHEYNLSGIVGVDLCEERCRQAADEFDISVYGSVGAAIGCNPEVKMSFVSTSPLSHAGIIKECLEQGLHTFTEINLSDKGYEENVALAKKKGLVLFLSSTFMYRREVEYIKRAVSGTECELAYIYHVGQYLPDWHPWESYKDFFVGTKETNGCRELMAVEFPWVFDVFGMPKRWDVVKGKKSSLHIDYPDTYQISMIHEGGTSGLIQIDVVSRKAVRNFECSGEDLYLTWDGTPSGLGRYNFEKAAEEMISLYDSVSKRKDYSAFIIEDAYLSEIMEFLNCINKESSPRYSFEQDRRILSVIDKIEGENR